MRINQKRKKDDTPFLNSLISVMKEGESLIQVNDTNSDRRVRLDDFRDEFANQHVRCHNC